jgi:hypothetical protein
VASEHPICDQANESELGSPEWRALVRAARGAGELSARNYDAAMIVASLTASGAPEHSGPPTRGRDDNRVELSRLGTLRNVEVGASGPRAWRHRKIRGARC